MNKAEALYKNKNLAWVNYSNSESVSELPGSESKEGNKMHHLPPVKEQTAFSKVRKVCLIRKLTWESSRFVNYILVIGLTDRKIKAT